MNPSESTENIVSVFNGEDSVPSNPERCKKSSSFVYIISHLTYTLDLIVDFVVAFLYFYHGQQIAGSIVILCIFLPNLGYLVALIYTNKNIHSCNCSRHWINNTFRAVLEALLFMPNAIRMNIRAFNYEEIMRQNLQRNFDDAVDIAEYDAYRFRFIDTRLRIIPQAFAQTYFVIRDALLGQSYTCTTEIVKILSIVSSFVSTSWTIAAYGGCIPEIFTVNIDGKSTKIFKPYLTSTISTVEKCLVFFGYVFVLSASMLAAILCIYGNHYVVFAVIFLFRTITRLTRNWKWKYNHDPTETSQTNLTSIICEILMIVDAELIFPNKHFHFTHSLYVPVFFVQLNINSIFLYVWWLGSQNDIMLKHFIVVAHYAFYMCGIVFIVIFYYHRHFRTKYTIVEADPSTPL